MNAIVQNFNTTDLVRMAGKQALIKNGINPEMVKSFVIKSKWKVSKENGESVESTVTVTNIVYK